MVPVAMPSLKMSRQTIAFHSRIPNFFAGLAGEDNGKKEDQKNEYIEDNHCHRNTSSGVTSSKDKYLLHLQENGWFD